MSLGLRLKTDDGKFADIIVFSESDWNHPLHSHWRKSMRAAILWTPDKSGYASPDFTVNGVRFWLDTSGSSKFYRVGTKNIQVFPSATEQNIACLFYDEVHDKMYLARMTWSGTGGGLGRAFWTTGDTVFQRTGYANQKTYPEALAICQEKYISGNSDTQGLIFDGNSYGMQYGNFLNFSIDFYNGTSKFNSNSPTYNIFDMNGQVLIGTLAQAKALFGEGLIGYDWDNPYAPSVDPTPDGEEGPTDGEWDLPNDDPGDSPCPYSDLSAGLYRAYAMTEAQRNSFSDQLWEFNVLQDLKELLERPTDIVLGLCSLPFDVSGAGPVNIGFNWVNHWVSSGVTGYHITDEIQELDFGYIKVPNYSGTFFDYQPFSSAQLYLPYIGFVPLKMNEIAGRNLHVKYQVDVLSGDFTAWVTYGGSGPSDADFILKEIGYYQGNMAKPLPLTQQSYFNVFKKGAEIAMHGAAAIGSLATGSLEMLAAAELTHSAQTMSKRGNKKTREMVAAADEAVSDADTRFESFKRQGTQTINSALALSYVNSPIERNGMLDGSSGRTSQPECFLIMTVPDIINIDNQSLVGYSTYIDGPLSKVSGYTEVKEIRLHAGLASESELNEIESILRGGIII